MNDTFTIPITDLRKNAAKVISDVTKKNLSAIVMQRSKPKVVIADYEYFNSLEEALMDISDGIEAEKAKKEPSIPFEAYLKKRFGKSSL